MSRLTIDTGTAGNPATGDSLRTAFNKVNTNFTELYAELGADGSLSDLNFTDNIISTDNTNQNIILSPNGTGLIDVDNRKIINVANPISAQDAATKAYVDAQNVAQAITFVGDDSTGTAVNSGETFKIAGSGSVTTAVSGDTLTITGATTDLGDFTFSGNKLSTTSSNADMELDTAGTGNLVLKSGNFLPATDNTQYLGSADKRWHTLYVGPGSINVNGVSITESGGKISLGNSTSISGTLEVNEITSADSSAIQINDGVNISGNVHLQGNTITLGNITEEQTDQSLTTIYGAFGLYDYSGNHSMAMSIMNGKMVFEGNNVNGYALVPSNNNQYTLGNPSEEFGDPGRFWKNLYLYNLNFPDSTEQTTAARIIMVGDDSTGTTFNAGETIKIAGTQNITTAVSGDTVTITGPDLSSYATTTYVDNKVGENNTLTIKDDASTSISIDLDDTLEVLGATGISTSVSGSTLTITGPDLSSYLTDNGLGDLTVVGSTIQSPSNADITLDPSGTGAIRLHSDVKMKPATSITIGEPGEEVYRIWTQDLRVALNGTSNKYVDLSYENLTFTNQSYGGHISLENYAEINSAYISGFRNQFGNHFIIRTSPGKDFVLTSENGIGGSPQSAIRVYAADNRVNINDVSISGTTIQTETTNADLTLQGNGTGTIIANSPLKINAGYIEKINALTSSSTITVNCATASIHTVTLAVSTGFVISNLPTGGTVTLIITQGGSGSYTATFGTDGSSTVKFPGGAPTLSTAVGAIDVVTVFNDGTNYLGNIAKAYA